MKTVTDSNRKSRDEAFMREALKEAEKALETGNWPVGCVIVVEDKIISRGHNKVYSSNNKINHAEIDAMSKVSNILSQKGNSATLYVTYEPCPLCLGAILLNHFHRVVCGPDLDGSGASCMINNLPERFRNTKYKFELVSGVLSEECETLFLQGRPVISNQLFQKPAQTR